jgi:Bacterial Ig domain
MKSRLSATFVLGALLALSPAAATSTLAATAVDDSYAIDEDTQLDLGDLADPKPSMLANDTVDSGMPCVASYDATGLMGTLDATAIVNGIFRYTPPPDWNGATTFTYALGTSSGDVCTAEAGIGATVTITVNAINDAPSAAADSFSALTDRTLNIAAPGVLRNDSDVDGDPLTAVKVNSPSHGSVTLAADGAFSYTPDSGYTGSDAFTYKASDGGAFSPIRIVSLTVTAIPPPPSPTPLPTPTPVPPTASPEPGPTDSALPSDSGLETFAPIETGLPSASPSPGPVTGPVVDGGGLPIVPLAALALLVALLAIAGVYYLRSQRAGGPDDADDGFDGEAYGGATAHDELADDR